MTIPSQHYLNADFNFNLSHAPTLNPRLKEVAREWTHHGLMYGLSGDICLVDGQADPEFVKYIQNTTGHVLTSLPLEKIQQDLPFCPHGWDSKMRSILSGQNKNNHSPLPSEGAIIKANDRLTASKLEKILEGKNAISRVIYSEKDFAQFEQTGKPLMLKSRFSSSGLGNKIVENASQLPHSWIREELKSNRAFIAEPYLKREGDRACLFDLDKKGQVSNIQVHELVSSLKGSFLGIRLSPMGLPAESKLEDAIGLISRELQRLNYFGPVGVDSFYFLKNNKKIFRPLVEINARKTLGHFFRHIYQGLNLNGWACLKYIPRRRLSGPLEYGELDKKLGHSVYNPVKKKGILLISPLWRFDEKKKIGLDKLAVLFISNTREGLIELENIFGKYFEK